MTKMNRERAASLLLQMTRVLQADLVEMVRDDDTAKAIAVHLRYIADALSEETTTSTRSAKKRRRGYAIENRSQRIKRESGQ